MLYQIIQVSLTESVSFISRYRCIQLPQLFEKRSVVNKKTDNGFLPTSCLVSDHL